MPNSPASVAANLDALVDHERADHQSDGEIDMAVAGQSNGEAGREDIDVDRRVGTRGAPRRSPLPFARLSTTRSNAKTQPFTATAHPMEPIADVTRLAWNATRDAEPVDSPKSLFIRRSGVAAAPQAREQVGVERPQPASSHAMAEGASAPSNVGRWQICTFLARRTGH